MQPAVMTASQGDLQNLQKFADKYVAGGVSPTLAFVLNRHNNGTPIDLNSEFPWILVGGRNSIRQALSTGRRASFVAAPQGNNIYVEYFRTESHKGLAAYGSTLMAGNLLSAPLAHATTAMGRAHRNGGDVLGDYKNMMVNTYSPQAGGGGSRALAPLSKMIMVVALYTGARPVNATGTAINLGNSTTATGLGIQLASAWHI